MLQQKTDWRQTAYVQSPDILGGYYKPDIQTQDEGQTDRLFCVWCRIPMNLLANNMNIFECLSNDEIKYI